MSWNRKVIPIDIIIDELTECLINRTTGKIYQTAVLELHLPDLMRLNRWQFDWIRPLKDGFYVYGLKIVGSKNLEGLIALKPECNAVYVELVESAPHNIGKNGKYVGVGAHLFAVAAWFSFRLGYQGYVFFTAKSKLINHYKQTLNAKQIGSSRRMLIDSKASEILLLKYFSGGCNMR